LNYNFDTYNPAKKLHNLDKSFLDKITPFKYEFVMGVNPQEAKELRKILVSGLHRNKIWGGLDIQIYEGEKERNIKKYMYKGAVPKKVFAICSHNGCNFCIEDDNPMLGARNTEKILKHMKDNNHLEGWKVNMVWKARQKIEVTEDKKNNNKKI
jgi:hypothetical protein